ncbi:MAG TPA: hypothetical protein VK189_03825 [Thermoplasmata archaeon]|nr:hypothetical protein [Thermoplasmata archaeon]
MFHFPPYSLVWFKVSQRMVENLQPTSDAVIRTQSGHQGKKLLFGFEFACMSCLEITN